MFNLNQNCLKHGEPDGGDLIPIRWIGPDRGGIW